MEIRMRFESQSDCEPSVEEKIRWAVRRLVRKWKSADCPDTYIRDELKWNIKDAFKKKCEVTRRLKYDGEVHTFVTDEGVFRLILAENGVDWRDYREQERWFCVVMNELDRQLGEPS